MKKAMDDEKRFVAETSLPLLKMLAYQLDQFFGSYEAKCQRHMGTEIVEKVVWVFRTFPLEPKEMTLFRQLMEKSISRNDSCSRETVVWAFDQFSALFLESGTDTQLFSEATAALTGILYAKSKNLTDPRSSCSNLAQIFARIQQTFAELPEARQIKELVLLSALLKGEQGFIEWQWELLFGTDSVLLCALDNGELRHQTLQLLRQISEDSRGIFKEAIREPDIFYIESLAMRQGAGLLRVFERLNVLSAQAASETAEAATEVLEAYEALLGAVNWYNVRPPVRELVNMQPENSLMAEIMLLRALKYDITSMYTFNSGKKGDYYMQCLMRFFPSFVAQVDYLLIYYANMGDIWYNMEQKEAKSENEFAALNELAERFTVEDVRLAIELVGSYLAIYPAFPIIVDLGQPNEQFRPFIRSDGTNSLQLFIEYMGKAVENESICKEQQIFNLQLLEQFVEYFEYGLNLSLGVLSKTPDEQTVNYQFQFYLAQNDLKALARPLTIQFMTRALNDFYDEYVLQAIKCVLYSVNYGSASFVFFNIIYHLPAEVLGLLDDESLLQLEAITLETCREPNEMYSQYEQGRCLYALQNLARYEINNIEEPSDFISDVGNFISEYLELENISANLRKPLLYIIGMFVPRGWCEQSLIETLMQLAMKENRSQSTALRVIGILFQLTEADLGLQYYESINLQQCLEICLSSGRSKSGIFIAAVVAVRELFLRVAELENLDTEKFALLEHEVCESFLEKLAASMEQQAQIGNRYKNVNELNKLILALITTLSKAPINSEIVYQNLSVYIDALFTLKYNRFIHDPLIRLLHENQELRSMCSSPSITDGLAEYEYWTQEREQELLYMNRYLNAVAGDEPQ